MRRRLTEDAGQSTVELAVTIPIVLIALLVFTNVMMFVAECARFDRVSAQVARSVVTTVGYEQALNGAASSVISQAMNLEPGSRFTAAASVGGPMSGTTFLVDYRMVTCTLTYEPWPSPGTSVSLMGGRVTLPTTWTHKRTYVVDHFQPAALF